ncbi:MAG: ferredoxin reductase family protein [bacterium]|nr:ferredoxin reductase family protein [bacterium]
MRTKKLFWQILLWANWAVILGFWWNGSGGLFNQGLPWALIALGRLAGLAAAYMILQQFFFMGRLPLLEGTFGLDKLSRIHHTNGQRGLVLLLFHPALLILGNKALSGEGFIGQFKLFLMDYEHIWLALVGLSLFVAVVAVSLSIVMNKLRYESWYFVHLLVYGAIFSSFWHQIEGGTDLLRNQIFYGYWIALYTIVFTVHLTFRFLRPLYCNFRHGFYVGRIVRENYNTVSIYIRGRQLDKFNINPGQFMILRFLDKKLWWQAHPFSLSMMPNGQELRVTVKELGDFTKQVAGLRESTKIIIDGPYGVFTELFSSSPKVLFIAGGIGITPIRSLMEQMTKHKKDVSLLYSNRTQNDIVFRKELDEVAQNYNAKVTHILSDDPQYQGERGYVDKEKIQRLVPDLASREVFLCGPPSMMDAVIKMLKELGVPPPKIHFERFSL